MIVTVTANPSLDRLIALGAPLRRGAVHRAEATVADPGGKGVNVSRAVHVAGEPTVAVLPADAGDPLLLALGRLGVPARAVPSGCEIRSNITIAEPDGTTTKLNSPGAELGPAVARALEDAIVAAADGAAWVALCGSLPPGLPDDWYARIVERLAGGPRIAVDTSGPALAAVADAGVDLLKPNAEELAELVGVGDQDFEHRVAAGDLEAARVAAEELHRRSGAAVLATLGAAGALLVDGGTWFATPPPTTVRSTVGAGDSALAGYLLGHTAGEPAPARLRLAVAYGSAAAALPGTRAPRPDQLATADVRLRPLETASPEEPETS
ncbi:1-phosphofructokinase OS=Tsukamurella paurometabola (strain ATCC 8368 / DSM / CCUG 35730 / CIP 100753 / JCM 10117 / KCTC 9821 / NBRC 16120 / NCIMB 702349/ NCTC 13040) OX=521096 GN=Tpau_0185 PE=3 SV=1 [Tsukamurella paurometabola]|uniref:1-phosphofructokinase n=1 Tax=Tsukamurella paurometabola (strain ATCC 8368 / DSM 20162 / CCUG 35730 / CIP 100753 / JCM 10117 / KCTC 9821 / NBRC 16120 / NCIMB 702349 / NCTC 13040) TaxID=521096 RepID=D5UQK6_TSUPD|nr:hexose kinase [Tsukamurella paurometabola]ADG76839.1 1-phosphofructokinase [Tsukamurella paurometabola DSM 20162]SUP41859.1 6-phosphofructokinase isozyme 2 [Tsukamurella paurometabola]